MIDVGQARAAAERLIEDLGNRSGIEMAIDDRATREESWCWVFFYNSRAYLETGSFSHALTGNGPIVVEKEGGVTHELTAARPTDEQLKEMRDNR